MLYIHRARKRTQSTVDNIMATTVDVASGHNVLSTVDDDRHPSSTLNVQLCVQHDGRLVATASRGPSVSANTRPCSVATV